MDKPSGFLELLKTPLIILSQNGKLMAFTAILYLIFSSISFTLNVSSTTPFLLRFALKLLALVSPRSGTPDYRKLLVNIGEDFGIFLGIQTAYVVLYFFIQLFTKTAIISIASRYYSGNNLSLKELIVMVSRTWTRAFVTSIYIELLSLGYTSFFFLPFLVPSLLLHDHYPTILITLLVFLVILFITFKIYLSVVWSLAVVVSVVDDEGSYGISALGKARELVKGKRVHGFLLNLFYRLVLLVILMGGIKSSPKIRSVFGVIQVVLICVASMFHIMAYSVLYFQCKSNVKKFEGLEYSKISISSVLDEDLP
ncbi:hypothetical protein OSB04_014985 [Centaurea solstitialis]|uniref:Uncharacterized protein n=1 Tax=Centaurea solstitialis TaxID=347529 RepID=A0AA38WG40_9ASTR|nr:hypothetical protein OSB04_014985 [Centaurea solstitialis]